MLLNFALVLGGLILLIWGADRFVAGAAATARNLGLAPMLIGLTIVAFGTSAPEVLVSVAAALRENAGLAVGNAIGSNIANIGLVLGAAVLLRPMGVHSDVLRREVPILLGVTLLSLLLLLDNRLDRLDGVILMFTLLLVMAWLVRSSLRGNAVADTTDLRLPKPMTMARALTWTVLGLVLLLAGAQLLVLGAESLARTLGVPDLIIGLTVVAIGTSLPELAVTVVAALRNQHDLALGNIIGSNIFNLLAVLGVAGLIYPAALDPGVLTVHLPVMFVLTVAVLVMAYNWRGRSLLTRPDGLALLLAFFAYHGWMLMDIN
jgi:cation:H+ antiporter